MSPSSRRRRRATAVGATAIAVGALSVLSTAQIASAGTPIMSESFGASWTPGSEWALSGTYTPQIVSIGGQTPESALRLTPAQQNLRSSLTYTIPQPTSGGLDISFRVSQWGGSGSPPGNGMSFFLRRGSDPSNAATAGGGGAGLGYVGLPGGLVGVGLDRFGGFPWGAPGASDANGNDCGFTATSSVFAPDNIAIRGPGEPTGWSTGPPYTKGNGYCLRSPSQGPAWVTTYGGGSISFSGTGRTDGARAIRVTVDPITVANPQITVYYGATGSTTPTQVLQVPVPPELFTEPTFKFGFAGSTGNSTNNNEVWGVEVSSLEALAPVDITTASLPDGTVGATYSCTSIAQVNGVAPIAYAIATGTLPAGLTLDANTGQVCGTPTRSGTYAFTVSATDSRSPTASTGTKAYSIAVADSAPPCTPVNLASEAGITSATVSWDPNGSAGCPGVTSYEVEASSGRTCTTTAPDTKCTVTGLTAGATVRFRVRAKNGFGASAWSAYDAPAVPESAGTPAVPEAARTPVVPVAAPTISITNARAIAGRVIAARNWVSTAGTVSVRATRGTAVACRATRTVKGAGSLAVACRLNPATVRVLRRRAITLRITSTLTDSRGITATASRTVRVPRIAPRIPVTG